jgi:hypothetical protein
MTIKVLPAQRWMLSERGLNSVTSDPSAQPCPVRFNRPGIYLDGSDCWFEAGGGAWKYCAAQFKYDLIAVSLLALNSRQAEALRTLIAQGLASENQEKIYQNYWLVYALRKDKLRAMRRRQRCIQFNQSA